MGLPNLSVIAVGGKVSPNGDHYAVFAKVENTVTKGKSLVIGYGKSIELATIEADRAVEKLAKDHGVSLRIVEHYN